MALPVNRGGSRLMRRLVLTGCLLVGCFHFADSSLSLPDVSPVNAFLLQHPEKLDKYLLTPDAPDMPLMKCPSDTSPVYDFYSLGVRGGNCNTSPRMRPKEWSEYSPAQRKYIWTLQYFVPIWASVVLLLLVLYIIVKVAAAPKLLGEQSAGNFVRDICLGFGASFMSYILFWPLIWVWLWDIRPVLPIALPDPNTSGLNNFLQTTNPTVWGNTTLSRCELGYDSTSSTGFQSELAYDIYVAFPDPCYMLRSPRLEYSKEEGQKLAVSFSGWMWAYVALFAVPFTPISLVMAILVPHWIYFAVASLCQRNEETPNIDASDKFIEDL